MYERMLRLRGTHDKEILKYAVKFAQVGIHSFVRSREEAIHAAFCFNVARNVDVVRVNLHS